ALEHLNPARCEVASSRPWKMPMNAREASMRSALSLSRVLLAASTSACVGCVSIPADALRPARFYTPRVERVSVVGFQRAEWRRAGSAAASFGGQYVWGSAGATWGQYFDVTDAPSFRRMLENTGCPRVVDEGGGGPLRVDGAASGRYVHGWNTAVVILEAI